MNCKSDFWWSFRRVAVLLILHRLQNTWIVSPCHNDKSRGGKGSRGWGDIAYMWLCLAHSEKEEKDYLCTSVVSLCMLNKVRAKPFVNMDWEVHGNMSLIPWGAYVKAVHRQISGILALSFQGLSLALLPSTKEDSLCLTWGISLDVSPAVLSASVIGPYTSTVF